MSYQYSITKIEKRSSQRLQAGRPGWVSRYTHDRLRFWPSPWVIVAILVISCLQPGVAQADTPTPPPTQATPGQVEQMLIPMGGGYADVYAGFSAAAVAHAKNGIVKILVLPTTYSSNPDSITADERTTSMRAAEGRRVKIEEACQRAAPAGATCQAVLIPVFTHSDALEPAVLELFGDDVSAIFCLDGDQTVAMRALIDTPLEQALAQAYERGVPFAGSSAGGALQSAVMLGGYNPPFTLDNAMDFGAPEVWNRPDQRGLSFGLAGALLDPHFFQRGQVGHLLNAMALPDVPHIGVGIDASTGLHVINGERLRDVFGLYDVAVFDAETYHAAEAVRYSGSTHTLSLRNVLVHLLAPGEAWYDLPSRQHALGAPATRLERTFGGVALPPGAGALILAGDLSRSLENNAVLARFVELAGGPAARIVIVAAAYPSERSAQASADKYAAALGVKTQVLLVPPEAKSPITLPQNYTGILFIARDQSQLNLSALAPLKPAWLAGKVLLADDAATAALGQVFSAHPPTPDEDEAEEAELATQKSFIQGNTQIKPGLNFLNLSIEPQIMSDNRWGRLFSLAYTRKDLLALGVNSAGAVELTRTGAQALGNSVVFALDFRTAKLELGSNKGYVVANGLLDVFAPGDRLKPEVASIKATPTRFPTPFVPTPTQTTTPTVRPSDTPIPTLTPTPTLTPIPTLAPTPTLTPTPTPTATLPPASAPPDAGGVGFVLGWGALVAALMLFLAMLLVRSRHTEQ